MVHLHTHDHGHSHDHGDEPEVGNLHAPIRSRRADNTRRLTWALGLTLVYMVAELVGGYLSNSLALLADAGHMFSDAAALGLSLFAIRISRRPPTAAHTYGFYRAEILAALANGVTLVVISLFVLFEAIERLRHPNVVFAPLMLGIATGGLAFNLIGMAILHGGKGESLNVHGAWLHLASDALGSVAAITAGGLIWAFGWEWADPVVSVVIGLLIIWSSWGLLKESIAVLMESAPRGIDVDEIDHAIRGVRGVCGAHDLHIWTITSGLVSLSVHVVIKHGEPSNVALQTIRQLLADRFGIGHVTIQIEMDDEGECRTSFPE